MAFDSRLPAAYLEEGPVVTRVGTDHLVTFDYAEPSPIMLFFQRWWRRSITMLKVGVVVGAVVAYPVMTVMSHRIDDSDVVLPPSQNWASAESGVAINKIARELEGTGWAGDRASWHPQARLTAMPAWQKATADALAEHARLMSVIAATGETPDPDLTAASRLLHGMPGDDMRPRLTSAAEALNRFDTRAARGLAVLPSRPDLLKAESRLFAGWAETDLTDLTTQINRDVVEWPASRSDIIAFYGAKARAHVAREMLMVAERNAPRLTRDPAVQDALTKARDAWGRAARMKPLIVSNQPGDGMLMANHLASMGFYLTEANRASLALADALDTLPAEDLESVAALDADLVPTAP
ncbi:hypothetical protein [Hyphomonas johnsonii]|jgi:hypothetical protein|uniref:Uncharacterized protein n=1 Tax=Hyphomonas johnsonii MHS-2 TaxID=1280950 RepID=A0A059FJJ9_9PROT|nr:hypothetical protein [Hyphomonas johnsonii]KCZ90787.1 hypothetical protein HJO_13086 [Hyphomonas johnsonii MHS-2]